MSLSHGPQIIAIPGPSPVPDRVMRAMHRVSPDIYGGELSELNMRLFDRLAWVAGADAPPVAYIGNGHAGWEAVHANLLAPGDKVVALISGAFGWMWAEQTAAQGVEVVRLSSGPKAPDLGRLAEVLAADPGIRAVMVCQIDTASSVQADIPAIRAAMAEHEALLIVDAIASLGCAPMRMADWGVDVLIAASQKGLMCPPGGVFTWMSDRAMAKARPCPSPWWDWRVRRQADALWRFWGGTPPVQLMFGLVEALAMLEAEGLEAVWARHAALAETVGAAFQAWGEGSDIALTVADPGARAASVTAVHLPGADWLRAWLADKAGLTLGIGLGAAHPANALRVAHMGHCNAVGLLGTLAAMEAGMAALAIPRGPGALDAAARVVAARA